MFARARACIDTVHTGVRVWGQPSLELAKSMPRDFCDMSNEVLCIYAAQGDHEVRLAFVSSVAGGNHEPGGG